jgi:hypothetical protein
MRRSTGSGGLTMKVAYYEASEPGLYGGVRALARYSGMPVKTVKGWLQIQDRYTLHKPVVKKFPRRKTFSKGIDDLFQADLADMRNLASTTTVTPTYSSV